MDNRTDSPHSTSSPVIPGLKTFLVCGMTGVGKSTFINKVTGARLSTSDRIDSDTVDVIEKDIPLVKAGDEYIQLVDTPGFGDSRETSETEILRRITEWLVARHMSKVPVTGVLFLRPIYDVRANRLEKALMAMFKDLCGNDCLDHIFLVTTRWSPNPTEGDKIRESELVTRPDFFGSEGAQRVQVRRLNDGYSAEEAQHLVKSCAGLPPVTFQIQREVVDEDKTLGETQAGIRIGADLEEKLTGLEEKAKKASEYAAAAKRKLDDAELAKKRLEGELAQAAEKAKQAAEAAEAARRVAEDARNLSEQERKEAAERARKAEEDVKATQQQMKEATERLEKDKKKLDDRLTTLTAIIDKADKDKENSRNEIKALQDQIKELSKPVKRGFWQSLVKIVTLGLVDLIDRGGFK